MIAIKDLFVRNPLEALGNNGQARIIPLSEDRAYEDLRYELSTFVCDGAFRDGLVRLTNSFIAQVGKKDASQKGVWISGFFGSGKSHFLKMAAHLWANTRFPDGSTAQSLVRKLPDDVLDAFVELDAVKRRSGGLMAAAGTLLGGDMKTPRNTILGVLLRAAGLPEEIPQARFRLWLEKEGHAAAVEAALKAEGRDLAHEVKNLHVSPYLAKAVIKAIPGFASTPAEAMGSFRAQFPTLPGDITSGAFVELARDAMLRGSENGKLPCTLIILDEVQQFIGDSRERSSLVTETVEALSKEFDGHVMVVGAGQNSLSGQPLLEYMKDRFQIPVNLQDADVEAVTRQVLLQKNPSAIADIRQVIDRHSGEIARHLAGSTIAPRHGDDAKIVEDYPLLPSRRRFWEECFRQLDATGTKAQLRSQLRILSEALQKHADKPLGSVIPADHLFQTLAGDLVSSGLMLREINDRINKVMQSHGDLAYRICGLVFLIGKLDPTGPRATGVKATADHIADLMITDLGGDNGKFRDEVARMLDILASESVLQPVDGEYRLQTKEGNEWDQDFRQRRARIQGDETRVIGAINAAIEARIDSDLKGIRMLTHGLSKTPRRLEVTRLETEPKPDGEKIPVWIRDGWSAGEKEFAATAQKAGLTNPTVFVFIPKTENDNLRNAVISRLAAQETIEAKGIPGTDEGKEARKSMETRVAAATSQVQTLVGVIMQKSRVFQGGGNERTDGSYAAAIEDFARKSFDRLFPNFEAGDSAHWGTAFKHVSEGADAPLKAVGHTDTPDKHAVGRKILEIAVSGMTGADIRTKLETSPYGWPQESVETLLLALHRSQHLLATENGTPIKVGELDRLKIRKAIFRVEKVTLTAQQKIELRGLYQKVGIKCASGQETEKAGEFFAALAVLAATAGGVAPLPAPPDLSHVDDMRRLSGAEQLLALVNARSKVESDIASWEGLSRLASARRPAWDQMLRLSEHAQGLPEARKHLDEIEAVRSSRSLLASLDPVDPIAKALSSLLRVELSARLGALRAAVEKGLREVEDHLLWTKTSESDRAKLIERHRLVAPTMPNLSTDDALLQALQERSFAVLMEVIEGVPARVARLVADLAQLHEPKVQLIRVDRRLLRNSEDVDAWIGSQRQALLNAIRQGPVQVE